MILNTGMTIAIHNYLRTLEATIHFAIRENSFLSSIFVIIEQLNLLNYVFKIFVVSTVTAIIIVLLRKKYRQCMNAFVEI